MTSIITTSSQQSSPLTELPLELVHHVMQFCSLASLEKLNCTCHLLSMQVFALLASNSPHTERICSKLLQYKNKKALHDFLANCKSFVPLKKHSLNLSINQHNWNDLSQAINDLPQALRDIQTMFSINSLGLKGDFNALSVSTCLEACSETKLVSFHDCHMINFAEIPQERFHHIEQLFFLRVTFRTLDNNRNQPLSEIANRCKTLKQFIFERCRNFIPDFHNFSPENNHLEYVSETNWCEYNVHDTWQHWVRACSEQEKDALRKSQATNAFSKYFFACLIDNDDEVVIKHKKYLEIKKLLNESLKQNSRFVNPMLRLANWIKHDDDWDEQDKAEKLFKESLLIAPHNLEAHVDLGCYLLNLERDQEGYEYLEKALPPCLARGDLSLLLDIVAALEDKFPQKSQYILDHVFWEAFYNDDVGVMQKILHVSSSHTLTIAYSINYEAIENPPDELTKPFEDITSIYLAQNDLPGLLLSAFVTKKFQLLDHIKKVLISEVKQEAEQALQKLMETLYHVPSWIILLKALVQSKQSIIPFLSLVTLFMGDRIISREDFTPVVLAFGISHNDWFTKSKAFTTASRKAFSAST